MHNFKTKICAGVISSAILMGTAVTCLASVEKGSYYTFDIADSDAKKGYTYKFSGMGNDPELDCKITGYFNAH